METLEPGTYRVKCGVFKNELVRYWDGQRWFDDTPEGRMISNFGIAPDDEVLGKLDD